MLFAVFGSPLIFGDIDRFEFDLVFSEVAFGSRTPDTLGRHKQDN
jgi:hypothetical protein